MSRALRLPWARQLAVPIAAVLATAASAVLLLAVLGLPIDAGLQALFLQPLVDVWGWSELVLKATPLLLCAIGLVLCYRAGIWNIGAEGQFVLGALCAGWVALQAATLGVLALPLSIMAGIAGGALLAGLAAVLRTRFGASEILTTIMLNYLAIGLLTWAVHGPLRDPDGFSFPESALFEATALLPPLFEGARITLATAVALLALIALWWLLDRTFGGYQIEVLGRDQSAARFAGFSVSRLTWCVLLVSGALAGFAGATEVTGPVGQLTAHVAFGYGYSAIIVAFIGRLRPLGVLFGSVLLALTYLGGENLQMETGVSRSITVLLQGLLLLFLLAFDGLERRFTASVIAGRRAV